VASGEFRRDLDIRVASYGLLGMLNWSYKWYNPQGRLRIGEVADEFTALALAGVAATGAALARTRRRASADVRRTEADPAAPRI
jgi:hypothetical protein